jgi:hypothetical protein
VNLGVLELILLLLTVREGHHTLSHAPQHHSQYCSHLQDCTVTIQGSEQSLTVQRHERSSVEALANLISSHCRKRVYSLTDNGREVTATLGPQIDPCVLSLRLNRSRFFSILLNAQDDLRRAPICYKILHYCPAGNSKDGNLPKIAPSARRHPYAFLYISEMELPFWSANDAIRLLSAVIIQFRPLNNDVMCLRRLFAKVPPPQQHAIARDCIDFIECRQELLKDGLLADFGNLQFWNLEYFVVPASVTHIPRNMFNGWTNLRHLAIPLSVQSIDQDAFIDCPHLFEVECDPKWLYLFQKTVATATVPDDLPVFRCRSPFDVCHNSGEYSRRGTAQARSER